MKKVITIIAAVLLAGLLPAAAEAQVDKGNDAGPAELSVSDVFVFGTQRAVTAASSTLLRTNHSVAMTINTRGLVPGHVYTVWWVIFDKPQFCASIPCTAADLGNAAIMRTTAWATGAIANGDGFAQFAAHIVSGSPEGMVLAGNGVFNTRRAEIHLILVDHGIVGAGGATLIEQLTTNSAGCGGPCPSVQASIHLR